ncbi:MAG: ComEC/Rec2 family competence protein [Bacillota bacterium]|nr:ComEC/Rec2 family competence protein [Bacillota bacterium]
MYAASLRVHFLNVGQGDAILIQSSPGGTALIDGGPRAAGPGVVTYLKAQGVGRIDLLIATHPHADHIGGLVNVLGAFPVARIIDSGMPHTSDTFSDFLSAIEKQVLAGGCVYETPESQVAQLAANVTVTVLGPERLASSANDSSVVCRLDFGSTSFLFTGDAEEPAERALILAPKPLDADVLKVGHHGSSTSTSAPFLAAVTPIHAVVSVGTNTFGHPSSITLNRLTAAGATVHRTDVAGHIIFESDGESLQIAVVQGVFALLIAPAGNWLAVAAAGTAGSPATAKTAWGYQWP